MRPGVRNLHSVLWRAGLAALACSSAVAAPAAPPAARPRLIVQITADQLRGDLLDRYRSVLTDGFGRLERAGYWVHHGNVDFGLTLSFPGHATLATGMTPAHHGLTANEWWMQDKTGAWNEIDVSVDDSYRIIGAPNRQGVSPRNLLATTLGEWVKASDPRSKSLALGTGNRIPVAYAGHRSDGAYWFDPQINGFTTSSYYASALPVWVSEFNAHRLPAFQPPEWSLTVSPAQAALAAPSVGEGRKLFPHIYAAESRSARGGQPPEEYARWFDGVPLKDEALFALAADAVDAERLGQRGVVDYLAIDVDSTDGVGHAYGPVSLEQLDTLNRMDKALGDFLRHLDQKLGKGNYLVALSADHGVVSLNEPGHTVRQVKSAELEALLDQVEPVAQASYASEVAREDAIVETLRKSDFVADAYTERRLAAPSGDPFLELYRKSMRPDKTTDFPLWTNKARPYHPARYHIIVRFKPDMIIDAATAVHGSSDELDRLIPILLYGEGIVHGEASVGGRSVDVAPTLAAAAGIASPVHLDGHPLSQALSTRDAK